MLFRLGRYREALDCEDRVAKLEAGLSAVYLRGCVLREVGCITEALEEFKRPVLTNSLAFWYARIGALIWLGQEEEAAAAWKGVKSFRSGGPDEFAERAAALVRLGEYAEAKDCATESIQMSDWSHLVDLAWLSKGQACAQLGATDEALACFDKAVELGWSQKARALFEKASTLAELGQKESAEKTYEAAVKVATERKAWMEQGEALQALGKKAKALAAFTRATESWPTSVRAWRLKAKVLVELDRKEEALRAFRRGAELGDTKVQEEIKRLQE